MKCSQCSRRGIPGGAGWLTSYGHGNKKKHTCPRCAEPEELRRQGLREQLQRQRCHECGNANVVSAIQNPGTGNEYESFRCRACAEKFRAQCYHDQVVREGHIDITDAIQAAAKGVATLSVTDMKRNINGLWANVALDVRPRPPRTNWRNQPQDDVVRLTVSSDTIHAMYYGSKPMNSSQVFRVPVENNDYPRKVIDRLQDFFDGLH